MPKKIVISANYLCPEDLAAMEQAADCRIVALPKLTELSPEQMKTFEQSAQDADLVILALFGSPVELLDRLPLDRIRAPKALWSFDSHHGWPRERQRQARFDHLFIAHSPYLKFFDEPKSHWLPCCFIRFSRDQLFKLLSDPAPAGEAVADIVFPHKHYDVGSRQDLEPALRRACARLGHSFYSGPVESGLPYQRAIQQARVVLNVSIKDDLNIRNFEAWAWNRVLLANPTPDHARLALPQDSTFFFQRHLGNFEEQLERAWKRSQQPVQTSEWVLNHHMLAHRLLEMIDVCLGQNSRLPEIQVPEREAGHAAVPAASAPGINRSSALQTSQPISGSRGNVGVVILANRSIAPSPGLCATRLQIEDNIGEAIHLHWRELRLDFSVRDFLALSDACAAALARLQGKPIRINPLAAGKVNLSPAFVHDLGAHKHHIVGAECEEMFLDDLIVITYHGERVQHLWKPFLLTQSIPFKCLQSKADEASYTQYQQNFSTAEHTLDKFQQLVVSLQAQGYPSNGECIILHGDEPYIRDGQHRAAILRHFLGNVKVPVVRLLFAPGYEQWRMVPKGAPLPGVTVATPVAPVPTPRILFVRTDAIGDVVLASSMLEPLRRCYPHAQIAVLCQQHIAELFMSCPFVHSVICYDEKKVDSNAAEFAQIISEITAFKPDVILNSVRSRDRLSELLTLSYRNAKHIGIEGDLDNISEAHRQEARRFYELLVKTPDQPMMELERHADFLRGLDIATAQLAPVVWTTPADEALAEAYFQTERLEPRQTLALFPFTQHAIKDYPAFAAALKDFAGWNILLLGGAESREQCEQLALQLPGNVLNLAGRTTLREMAALIRRCKILVGSDSCAAHIACAVGVPNVVVLGGGHFGRFMPYSPLTSVVVQPLDCFGCNWRCRFDSAHCIADIAPEVLKTAITSALKGPRPKPAIFARINDVGNAGRHLPPALAAWLKPEAVDFLPVAASEAVALGWPSLPSGPGIGREAGGFRWPFGEGELTVTVPEREPAIHWPGTAGNS